MTAATATLSRDARVLGLISGGHFISHFYQLCLPPLLLVWRAEFGASFAALGAVITLFALATGLAQIPAGILVDRFGARPFLIGGLIIVGASIAAMGLATSLEMVYLLAVIAGFGNSVFHPADYAILNSSIGAGRIGKAFGIHTFSGHLGGAIAPATIIFLTAAFDWRVAMMIAGLFSLVAAVLILAQGGVLKDENRAGAGDADQTEAGLEGNPSTLKLMLSRGMLMFFLFFLVASMTTSGVHSFSVVALVNIQGIGLASASSALTAFLLASALGILLGGVIADRFGKHDETAIIAFIVSGIVFVVVAQAGLQMVLVVALFTIAGLAQGILRPARDMMVRAMAPKGAVGRVFGYVSTGIALGSGIAPVLFGWMVDKGVSAWIFWLLAGLSLLGILIVLVQKRSG